MRPPKDIIPGYPIRLKKRLGQHILKDREILRFIVESCEIHPDTTVLEIGAGVANLTEGLAMKAKHVVAVEIDPQFQIYHKRLLIKYPNVSFIYENILDINLENLEQIREARDLIIAGNIPYNITSPLVMKILEGSRTFRHMILMVQKELAHRFCAPPGTRNTSAITLKIHFLCEPRLLRLIPGDVFHPLPSVDSALIRFIPHCQTPLTGETRLVFFRFLDAAFSQRRKTILNSLGSQLGTVMSKKDLAEVFQSAGIDPGKRPEAIQLEEYLSLFDALRKMACFSSLPAFHKKKRVKNL